MDIVPNSDNVVLTSIASICHDHRHQSAKQSARSSFLTRICWASQFANSRESFMHFSVRFGDDAGPTEQGLFRNGSAA